MGIENTINEMDLPLSNENEELSIISESYFKPLFDTKDFIIRSAQERDKGIDFQIELKSNNKFTNFHFAIQLKATDTKKANKDETISLNIQTSNINYLLNNPMPAYYVLYYKATNTFYYESINEFAKVLYQKNQDWNNQSNHTIRFSKILDQSTIKEIYNETIKKGKFQRIINENTSRHLLTNPNDNSIVIDNNLNVSTDAEIRELIEKIGFEIINEGRWKDLILVHKKGTGNIAITAKYNLILGIANYYNGNLIEALSFIKKSINLKSELNIELNNQLQYFEASIKYSIGLINKEEYDLKINPLENTETFGYYIKIEKIKQNYVSSMAENSKKAFEIFCSELIEIISNINLNKGVRLFAKSELILYQGFYNNVNFVKGVSMINAIDENFGPILEIRVDKMQKFNEAYDKWFEDIEALKKETLEQKNYFIYHTIVLNEIKVLFEFNVYANYVKVKKSINGEQDRKEYDPTSMLEKILIKNSIAYNYFNNIGHIQNKLSSLFTKYEILHFLDKEVELKETIEELEILVDSYDLSEAKEKLTKLKNKGTTHESFKIFLDKLSDDQEANKREFEKNRSEMIAMDSDELQFKKKLEKDSLIIELFPLGHFQFPISKKEFVYEIIMAEDDAKKSLDNIFKFAIPVVNIYNNPILKEGYDKGKLNNRGIESWRNIYRIRKLFYENKFYRFDPNI